jgi:hypothetical protein
MIQKKVIAKSVRFFLGCTKAEEMAYYAKIEKDVKQQGGDMKRATKLTRTKSVSNLQSSPPVSDA